MVSAGLTHQTDLADVRVHLVMRPHASEAIVTLPHVVRAPTEVVSRDQSAAASSVLQHGEFFGSQSAVS